MKILKTATLVVIFIFVIGLFYWALFMPKEDVSQRIYKTLKEQEKRADLYFKNVTFEEVSAGIKYWQLLAETAMVNKSTGIATLQNAEGIFFKKGKAVLKFRSPAAMWDMKKKEIYLDKPLGYNVMSERKIALLLKSVKKEPFSIFSLPEVYKKELGYWFQANNLSWKLADEKLLCTGGIRLTKGEVTGYANELEGDVALEKVVLKGNPRIIVHPNKTFPVTIEAETFEVLSTEDTFLAHGNPKINWGTAMVEAENVKYLQIDKKLELRGGVKVSFNDIHATGDSANYLTVPQQVLLEGNAQAEQGENKLSGQKVLVSLKDQKISLLGSGKVVIPEEEIQHAPSTNSSEPAGKQEKE